MVSASRKLFYPKRIAFPAPFSLKHALPTCLHAIREASVLHPATSHWDDPVKPHVHCRKLASGAAEAPACSPHDLHGKYVLSRSFYPLQCVISSGGSRIQGG